MTSSPQLLDLGAGLDPASADRGAIGDPSSKDGDGLRGLMALLPGGPGAGGLTGEYADDRGLVVTETDPTLSSGMQVPAGVQTGQVQDGVTWSGHLNVATSGTYRFIIDLGQGVSQSTSVKINGQDVYDYSVIGSYTSTTQNPISLTANSKYPIVISCANANFNWSPEAIIIDSNNNQTALTAKNFSPAVTAISPGFSTDLQIPGTVIGSWNATDEPVGFALYREPANGPMWHEFDLPFGNYGPTVTGFTDTPQNNGPILAEGQTYQYFLKSEYNNPVTGQITYSTATESDEQVPAQIDLEPANTGNGKITMFWSGPPDCVTFKIYQDSAPGNPTNLIATVSPASVQDSRYGQTNSYMDSVTGLTPGTTYYFTVQGLDANNNVIHSSEQQMCDAELTGIPWDESNTYDLENQIISHSEFSGDSNPYYYYIVAPSGELFSFENGIRTNQLNVYNPTSTLGLLLGPNGVNQIDLKPFGGSGTYFEWYTASSGYNQYSSEVQFSGKPSDYSLLGVSSGGNWSGDSANLYTGGGLAINGQPSAPIDAGLESLGRSASQWILFMKSDEPRSVGYDHGNVNFTRKFCNSKIHIVPTYPLGTATGILAYAVAYDTTFLKSTVSVEFNPAISGANLEEINGVTGAKVPTGPIRIVLWNSEYSAKRASNSYIKEIASIAEVPANCTPAKNFGDTSGEYFNSFSFGDTYFDGFQTMIAGYSTNGNWQTWDTTVPTKQLTWPPDGTDEQINWTETFDYFMLFGSIENLWP